MAYTLQVSREQLVRIHAALEVMDERNPLQLNDYQGLEMYNMESLTSCIHTTLEEPESATMVHGICL